MAKSEGKKGAVGSGGAGGDGSNVPSQSAKLDGDIISAAGKSIVEGHSFEKGYPEPPGRLKMENVGGKKQ